MALARSRPSEAPLPPCAVCGAPAAHPLYEHHLCDECEAWWLAEAPPLQSLEMAHADAHPEDVELCGTRLHLLKGESDARWVTLKRGITERLAKAAAGAWVLRARKVAA